MKKILLCCLALASLSVARAQLTYGPELGFNISDYRIHFPFILQPTTVPVPGAHLGIVGNYHINDRMAIEPGLFYSLNGIKYKVDFLVAAASATAHLNTIRIPVNFQYTFGHPGNTRFFAGIGPFVGVNLGGYAKLSVSVLDTAGLKGFNLDTTGKVTAGNASSDYIRRFDLGGSINVGCQLTSGLFLRANYAMGFLNLAPEAGGLTSSIKSANYAISVGYLIGYNDKKKSPKAAPHHRIN